MSKYWRQIVCAFLVLAASGVSETKQINYFGHNAEVDQYGVIAPWYPAQNGQFDYRVRIAAETMKRYPWSQPGKAVTPAPEYVYNGHWNDVDYRGRIASLDQTPWNNGDVGQRNAYVLSAMIDYYRYSGDPAVYTAIAASANYLIDHCETPANHGWPKMLISVPTMGDAYFDCKVGDVETFKPGHGKIQLDIVAAAGVELVRAYELTGNTKWLDAAKHWADLMVANRRHDPSESPWGRYANNNGGNGMNGTQTGGVVFLLNFFDELIRVGYTGQNGELVKARDEGRAYLKDVLLPNWTRYDVWGRNFWDWEAPVQDRHVSERSTTYMMDHKDVFPNWKNDVRNILTLLMNHNSVSPVSRGDVYSGAWAYPESSTCCGRSLWYVTNAISSMFTRYGSEAHDEWAYEIGRRSQILGTYDISPTGHSEDLLDGGAFVSWRWLKNAGPKALKDTLRSIQYMPELAAPARENHIVGSTAVVRNVLYEKGRVAYETFDAPEGTEDTLRLAFMPTSIKADGQALAMRENAANGYTATKLPSGDYVVKIRHDGHKAIVITGNDPQHVAEASALKFEGAWSADRAARMTTSAGASMTYSFTGNQFRLVGAANEKGGLADIFVDDMKQLVFLDCYSPIPVENQILYTLNGLDEGPHTVRIVARGEHNPIAKGSAVYLQAVQYSDATGSSGFGEGGGPKGVQRLIFGYTGRKDYIDSKGNAWKPGMEFVARTGSGTDIVARTWWTMRQSLFIRETEDEELYRYGAHWKDFTVNLTVGPGTYYARLKFAETQLNHAGARAMDIYVNDKLMVQGFDVFATAGSSAATGARMPGRPSTAVDLVFNDLKPKDGIIEIRFVGDSIDGQTEDAMVQAIEIGPGNGGTGATPKTVVNARPGDTGGASGQVDLGSVRHEEVMRSIAHPAAQPAEKRGLAAGF
ncbi:MAG: hypothetical protein JSS87_00350 [Acidobacteria bacterium]|nr:hypothetical protein [Acidobacteriota bacterium]